MSTGIKIQSIKEDSGYHALIHGLSECIKVVTVGCDTEDIKPRLSFVTKDAKKFLKDFAKTFKPPYKSIVFNVFQSFHGTNFDSIAFCDQLKEEVQKLKIPYYFISSETFLPAAFLAASKYTSEIGDIIFVPTLLPNIICSWAYQREADGYISIRQRL
uniref:Uncharacterized protein n=1 Tax=Panagrolaimus superbus TaxID=310955 RepID=A0A914Y659_9BILA